ncbi:MAG: PilZ domain-containing protein [Desulfobacterota bacterium]|nr:PilZ domain-containing protein [Thermodesulfobacteriota bacterium]
MSGNIERRECQRFEIPGATVQYKSLWFPVSFNGFSQPGLTVNVSKGGLAFECRSKMARGKKIAVRLIVPGEEPLYLRASVRWFAFSWERMAYVVGIEFAPFGIGRGENPIDVLDRLRELEREYGEKEFPPPPVRRPFDPLRDHLW